MFFLVASSATGRVATAAPADDIARLYALPPAGSVYVRVVNPSAMPMHVRLGADAREESLAQAAKIATDYRVLPGDEALPLRVNGKAVPTAKAPAGGFVTLVVRAEKGVTRVTPFVDEEAGADGLKAELAVYNLVPGCTAKVGVVDGPAVFPEIASGTRAVRAINPVAATLAGECGDKASPPAALPALQAGDRYSLFLVGTAAAPVLVGQHNRTAPLRAQ